MLTVVTGGSGSGKSELAENIAVKFTGKKYYIAAMQPFGEEALKRIYKGTGIQAAAEGCRARLNWNTASREVKNPQGKLLVDCRWIKNA